MAAEESEEVAELVTFQCRECYLYFPLPPALHYGHRAELWGVEDWNKEVRLRVVSAGDALTIKLEEPTTTDAATGATTGGELFAECPLPRDPGLLTTAVEPVIDSSRYFCLRVADRASGNHAFLGLGFAQREQASDFSAALDDYRQQLRRAKEAAARRAEYEERRATHAAAAAAAAGSDGGDGGDGGDGDGGDDAYSLKPGEKITINLSRALKRPPSSDDGGKAAGLAARLQGVQLAPPGSGLKLAPPPPPSSASIRVAPARASGGGDVQAGSVDAAAAPAATTAAAAPDGDGAADDDWGDFASAS